MKPLYISYYTPDYKTRAMALIRSLRRHDLEYEVVPMEEKGSWQKDSQHKPRFIWDMMTRHYDKVREIGRPLVWIDADAEVLAYPQAFEHVEADLMVCEFRNEYMNKTELLSGTVYFKNNVRSHRLVDAWIEECNAAPQLWDQKALQRAIGHFADDGLRIAWLPVSYCYIFDTHKRQFPDINPIICHYQESRAAKTRKPYNPNP